MAGVLLHEYTAAKNWPAGRRPEWADMGARLYTGLSITAAGREWTELVTVHEGDKTTVYLTQNGFDTEHHGPAVHVVRGTTACHRKAVGEFVRDQLGMGVDFA